MTESDVTSIMRPRTSRRRHLAAAYHVRLPDQAEGQGVGTPPSPLTAALDAAMARRHRRAAHRRGIFESTLVDELAPPAIADTSWVAPGRAAWSWWSDDNSPKNEAALNRFTDFAAEMGWEVLAHRRELEPDGSRRARSHPRACAREARWPAALVQLGGPHNVVTEQPRDRMHQRDVRRKEFAKLREWGIKGVKIDFWQSDKQDRIPHYLDTLRDAADYHLMVDFHGCTLPRGWERTFPHLMSMEAVQGAEQYKFNAEISGRRRLAQHRARLYAQRRRLDGLHARDLQRQQDIRAPDRLATSWRCRWCSSLGLQHFADSARRITQLPAEAQAFLKAVPAAWDESRLLAGEPGQLAVVARRKGERLVYRRHQRDRDAPVDRGEPVGDRLRSAEIRDRQGWERSGGRWWRPRRRWGRARR